VRRLSLVLLTFAATLAALLAGPAGPASAAAAPSGPDVSSWQHPNGAAVDWNRVKAAGQSYAFVKATEGTTYTNPYFSGDWAGIRSAGLLRSAYHYARPSAAAGSAAAQARVFAATIGTQTLAGTLPPVLDLEETGSLAPAALIDWTSTFLTTLQGLTGRTPMIYTYPYFWTQSMANTSAFTSYPLWMASYGTSAPPTYAWPTWTFWQYSATSSLDGIPTRNVLDMNRFNGTPAQLAALALIDTGAFGPPTTTVDTVVDGPPRLVTAPGPGSRYVPVTPTRFLDTRSGLGGQGGRTGVALTATLPGTVPAGATAVVLDVSVVKPSAPGWLRVSPAGQTPTTTALNYSTGQSMTGLAVTATDANRQVTLTPYGGVADLVADVAGYYTSAPGAGGHWTPVAPTRFVDTRSALGTSGGRRSGEFTITVPDSVPADATGVVLDVSAVEPTGAGYLRLSPAGTPATTTALNFSRNQSVTGLAMTRTRGRQLTVSVLGASAHVTVDVVGYYDSSSATGSGYIATTPQRFLDTRSGLGGTGPGTGPITVTLPVTVPQDATAAVLDVSVVDPTGSGWLRVSAGDVPPTTTALNFLRGQNQTGLAVTGVSNGRITLTVYGKATHLVADLVGYQTAR
jgi:GH25 family lysozyme M1 (1,4-beta-N-acetylmuramidase)